MMGTHQGQGELVCYLVDLNERVRDDHPLRNVLRVVDFRFMRDEVAPG